MSYSIISQPVCVTGPTGPGKTSAARAFARMRPHSKNNEAGFQMHSFHSGTNDAHFFGSSAFIQNFILLHVKMNLEHLEETSFLTLSHQDLFTSTIQRQNKKTLKRFAPAFQKTW